LDCSLSLIEAGVMGRHQTQRLRMILNQIAEDQDLAIQDRCNEMRCRVKALETQRNHPRWAFLFGAGRYSQCCM